MFPLRGASGTASEAPHGTRPDTAENSRPDTSLDHWAFHLEIEALFREQCIPMLKP
jgi:hypothetical protein